jgi:hypothetical protein
MWFLFIVGTKFNLISCCRSDRVGQILTSHVGRFGKCRCNPKSCGALVLRRAKNGSHFRAKLCTKTRKTRQGLNRKEICRSKYDMHKIKWTNRVKGKNLILNLWAQPRVENCARKNWQQYGKIRTIKQKCSKLSAVVALANLQQKE